MRPGTKSCLHTCIFFLITRFSTTLVLCPPPFCAHDRASFCARAQKGATQFPRFVPGHKIRTHAANDSGHKNRVNNMAVCPCFVPGHKVVPGGTAYLPRGWICRARGWTAGVRGEERRGGAASGSTARGCSEEYGEMSATSSWSRRPCGVLYTIELHHRSAGVWLHVGS